jgi:uncharacterized BrkB/YihY/UPF0761 family membrane protein
VFVTDPGAGFPPGAPSGPPVMSWHGALHEIGFTIVLLAWTVVCVVLRRRFTAVRQPAWARACLAAVLAAVVIGAWPDLHSLAIRLVAATAVQFGLLAAIAIQLHRAAPDAGTLSGSRML